ncbi:MAG: sensor histidine kinase, partial [Roseibium sp.]
MKTVTRRRQARKAKFLSISAMLIVSVAVIWVTGVISLGFFVSDVKTRSEASLKVQAAVLEGLLDKFRLMSPLLARSPDAS